ncbi:hypothetical protein BJ508DRAFT_79874 [Ascobolus immersus RN42]|uniref:Uncharacterized protein n=1 Tax=Ascobolus immersus RN42 TaxID=1160509 RepID=A0A3N4HG26_ASCIM|nr:hypothetical protein BJ508DRAFT_79874 [Ascobolus immersus RN42]
MLSSLRALKQILRWLWCFFFGPIAWPEEVDACVIGFELLGGKGLSYRVCQYVLGMVSLFDRLSRSLCRYLLERQFYSKYRVDSSLSVRFQVGLLIQSWVYNSWVYVCLGAFQIVELLFASLPNAEIPLCYFPLMKCPCLFGRYLRSTYCYSHCRRDYLATSINHQGSPQLQSAFTPEHVEHLAPADAPQLPQICRIHRLHICQNFGFFSTPPTRFCL